VRITDPHPFLESECGLQPRYRRSYVWVDEHRSDGGGRRRTIRQHGGDSNGPPAQGDIPELSLAQANVHPLVAGLDVFGTIDGVSETRDPLRRTFDTAADLYEAARPSYPNELFDD